MDMNKLRRVIETDCCLNPDQFTILGVSGGADSLCMFDVLNKLGLKIIVAHLDHAIREESFDDARYVEKVASNAGVPFISERYDVVSMARREKLSIEEAARIVRYRFLFSQAERYKAQAVAVAHTADDQIETILMHLLRGSGLSGLRGMSYRSCLPDMGSEIPVVRPLLGIWREAIERYCQENALNPRQDVTNQDTTYFRNRLRHELIPYLQDYNPALKSILWNMSRSMEGDYAILQKQTQMHWDRCQIHEAGDYVELSLAELRTLQSGEVRNLIRFAVGKIRPHLRDIGFEAVEKIVDFIEAPSRSAAMDVTARLKCFIEGNSFYISDWDAEIVEEKYPCLHGGQPMQLSENTIARLDNNWSLSCEIVELEVGQINWEQEENPAVAWIDAEKLHFPLEIRTWISGDRFKPLGMAGKSVKLSDFWVNVKLARRVRKTYPLVCSQGEIVWIPGYRLSHTFCVSGTTRKMIRLSLVGGER